MRVLLLHAYSSRNAGDGLLVDSSVELVRRCWPDAVITLCASHPESFDYLKSVQIVDSQPTRTGYPRRYLRTLRSINEFDLVVAVGGGYLRFGRLKESLKAAAVHLPQLLAAAIARTASIYLPQSIGPIRGPWRPLVRLAARRVDVVCLRDDRSMAELAPAKNRVRMPDLALMHSSIQTARTGLEVEPVPVVSVRMLEGAVPEPVIRLANGLREYDTFVQSRVRGNDDADATRQLEGRLNLEPDQLMVPQARPRVVVAMRLHAALMAIQSGHYVIHLSYERKGIAAFADLNLDEWVHQARKFEPEKVLAQMNSLLADSKERARYRQAIASATPLLAQARQDLLTIMTELPQRSMSELR